MIYLLLLLSFACQKEKAETSKASNKNAIPTSDVGLKMASESNRLSFDEHLVIATLRTLSSDEYQGRKTGTDGHKMAKEYVLRNFKQMGLIPINDTYEQPFNATLRGEKEEVQATNLIGYIKGSLHPDKYIAIGAHYDHVGVHSGEIHNGADDNASGVGGLLGMMSYFKERPPKHSILFLAFDAEESGLQGAKYFVANPTLPIKNIVMMLNMDMISRSDVKELYASGTHHYPFLKPHLIVADRAHPTVNLKFGHDKPRRTPADMQDWTSSSDHGPFHEAGIPYIYFGVEDHPHYHKPTDDFETINQEFYLNTVDLILDATTEFDKHLGLIEQQRIQQNK